MFVIFFIFYSDVMQCTINKFVFFNLHRYDFIVDTIEKPRRKLQKYISNFAFSTKMSNWVEITHPYTN